MKPTDQKIYLASKSPRRRELLRQIGIEFELLLLRDNPPTGPEVSEIVRPGEPPADYVSRVAREKVDCAQHTMHLRKLRIRPILSADTAVVIDSRILGKPADPAQAAAMLKSLSGRTHQVLTSIAVRHNENIWQITQTSDVVFGTLSDETISNYCATQEPYDKAGAYAIQGMGALFVRDMAGSYSGIMGLPLFETVQLLHQAGIHIL
jgi:septum formation protein